MVNHRPLLLVDDNDTHAFDFAASLEELRLLNPLRRVENVNEAIDYLSGENRFADRAAHPFPIVLFLDIRMADSHRLLAWMEKKPTSKPPGIIALTSSHDLRPIIQAYHLGVHSFLKEPPKLEDVRNALGAIPRAKLCQDEGTYWIQEIPIHP